MQARPKLYLPLNYIPRLKMIYPFSLFHHPMKGAVYLQLGDSEHMENWSSL